jgi:hypothetical protein
MSVCVGLCNFKKKIPRKLLLPDMEDVCTHTTHQSIELGELSIHTPDGHNKSSGVQYWYEWVFSD